jgi:hypothetical protein
MGDSDLAIVSSIIIFLVVMSFINALMPPAWQFVDITGIAVIGLGTAGVAAFCVLSTGIPCALALGVTVGLTFTVSSGLLSLIGLAATASVVAPWVGTLIITPLTLILEVFIAKLARGQ